MAFSDVNEVWAGKLSNAHVLLSVIGPYKLFCWDIARIAPDNELESEVSEFFYAHLNFLCTLYLFLHFSQAE